MEPERWKRIGEVFDSALQQAPETRDAFVRNACADDDALYREVMELLATDDDDPDLLSRPIGEVLEAIVPSHEPEPDPSAATGRRLGPYVLDRLLGRGGMGAVYLADREDVGLRCALKVVRGTLTDPGNIQRLVQERRVLARLEHPHIARLLDAGVSEEGDPWFAMELVEGEPIDRYCDHHRLTVEQRLDLFEQVCEAAAYAHRNLIVHRDIKPSNILVAEAGGPKLLDFGIAKLLEEPDEALTGTGMRLLTPGYAAPEQLRGEPVTTGTDVFGLGLVLYRLLSGHHAIPITGVSPLEIVERALTTVPPRPSDAAGQSSASATPGTVAEARTITPDRLRRRLAGDLDAIVMRALAPEPERRYGSAAALLAELRRHKQGRPVLARPDTWLYRSRAFLRRNRLAVLAAAGLVLLLSGVAATTTMQQRATARERDRAATEAAKASRVSDFLVQLFDVADPFSPDAIRADTMTVRDFLIQRGRIVNELADEPEIQLAVMGAVGRMYLSLGMHEEAEQLFADALAIGRRLHPDGDPVLVTALRNLAEVQTVRQEFAAGERHYREARELARDVLPDTAEIWVATLHGFGNLLRQIGKYDEAETVLREALTARQLIAGERSLSASDGLNNLGLALWARGNLAEAEPLLEEALAIQRQELDGPHPMTGAVLNNLGIVRRDRGAFDAAEIVLREALVMKQQLFGESHWRIANGMVNLSGVLLSLGQPRESEDLAREALRIIRASFGEGHLLVGVCLRRLGEIREAQGNASEAERYYREAVAAHRAALPANHPNISVSQIALGRFLVRNGRPDEAAPVLAAALEAYTARDGLTHQRTANAQTWLATARLALGQTESAERLLTQATETFSTLDMLDTESAREAVRRLESIRDASR